MSERLALSRSPPYRTPAEFISGVWTLFQNAAASQKNDDMLIQLQESFQKKLLRLFGAELHSSLLKQSCCRNTETERIPGSPRSKFTGMFIHSQTEEGEEEGTENSKGSEVTPGSNVGLAKLKETRKRLRDFLDTMGLSAAKKTNKMVA
ncbi:hypothetical protein LDENG_00208520 [Lucifuga dentata]|nr:hypothetical protein LDENG_00208520 [Lucifuga dentata]